MVDKEFICIWNDSLDESRQEFIKEFVEITSTDDKEGLYTFFFSRLNIEEHRLATDVLYSIVYKDTVLFLWPLSNSLVLELDDKLNVLDGINIHADNNIMGEILETPNIGHIGMLASEKGHVFDVFTLKETNAYNKGYEIYENLFQKYFVNMDLIHVHDDDIIDMSMEYLSHKIEALEEMVDKSIENDDADPRLVENPFGNRFYDKDDVPQPLRDKRMLGDSNV